MTDQADNPGDPVLLEHHIDDAPGVGGVVWKLPHEGDLDGNLVRLAAARSIEEHTNDDVDVLIVMRAGDGRLVVDGEWYDLTERSVALVRRGARRAITAGPGGIAYLSVHRHRSGLTVGTPTR